MKEVVIFDVDNTILKGFSQGLFVDYLYKTGKVSFVYRFTLILWFILYKLRLVKDPKPAMEYGLAFIKGKTEIEIENIVNEFFYKNLLPKIYPEALVIIEKHQSLGRELMLISNAPDIIIDKLSKYLKINRYLSTKLEIRHGVYTGNIIGDIMYGKQKLDSVRFYISGEGMSLDNSWGYADHESDSFILSAVTHPFAVNPSRNLRKIAIKNNWKILKF